MNAMCKLLEPPEWIGQNIAVLLADVGSMRKLSDETDIISAESNPHNVEEFNIMTAGVSPCHSLVMLKRN